MLNTRKLSTELNLSKVFNAGFYRDKLSLSPLTKGFKKKKKKEKHSLYRWLVRKSLLQWIRLLFSTSLELLQKSEHGTENKPSAEVSVYCTWLHDTTFKNKKIKKINVCANKQNIWCINPKGPGHEQWIVQTEFSPSFWLYNLFECKNWIAKNAQDSWKWKSTESERSYFQTKTFTLNKGHLNKKKKILFIFGWTVTNMLNVKSFFSHSRFFQDCIESHSMLAEDVLDKPCESKHHKINTLQDFSLNKYT